MGNEITCICTVTESLDDDVCTAGDGATDQCFGYCFRDDAVCVEGTCQCINNPFKDRCTCLRKSLAIDIRSYNNNMRS